MRERLGSGCPNQSGWTCKVAKMLEGPQPPCCWRNVRISVWSAGGGILSTRKGQTLFRVRPAERLDTILFRLCPSPSYTGSPSLLMMQMSRCIQHPSPQQVELRTTIANALDHFQSIHLRFELAIRPWLLE